jgi:signal transduction histidine kinase
MAAGKPRSISTPIVLSTISVLLTVALLVGWTLVIVKNMTLTRAFESNALLLVGGIVSFVVIMSVLVLFSVFLVREILEVRRQQTFIDSVTHELKSPLASIKLCLETLAREEVSTAQREQLRRMMLADVDRLSVFVGDILEASRIAHGIHSHLWTATDIGDIVQRSVENVQQRYGLGAEAVQLDLPPKIVIRTDPVAFETVLSNLLDNAVKYSAAPVHIRVSIRTEPNGDFELVVHDSGIGIAKSQLKRIFRRFYRVPNDEVYARSGTGLGLYVVAALVKNLGGRIEAYSPGPSQGTSITVRLPLVSTEATA